MLERGPGVADRDAAARALLASPLATDAQVEAALRFLAQAGETVVLRAARDGAHVRGWAAWAGPTRIPLSVALPRTAASYLVVALIGHYGFGEPLGPQRLGALALIGLGVVLLATA